MTDSGTPRRLPPLKALRALEAIHLTGSVTGAAQQLSVSHSAISHQVRILEDWSVTPLFSRNGRTTVLTKAGHSLATTTHRAFDEVRHEIDRLPLRQVSPITIATLPLLATEVILPKLSLLISDCMFRWHYQTDQRPQPLIWKHCLCAALPFLQTTSHSSLVTPFWPVRLY